VEQVKWDDSYGGNGEHYWEYNHSDGGYKAPSYDAAPAYAASAPAYSENYPTYEEAPSAKL
jgi:hypothetical protein